MKNTPLSAFVLVGAAGLVGWIAWAVVGDDPIDSDAQPVDSQVAVATPRVMSLTPHEQRLKGRLEGAKRQIEEYKRRGEVLPNGEIKVPDVDGSPLYVHPKLVEGVGRFGEPIYAMAKYKRRPAVPAKTGAAPKDPKLKAKTRAMPAGKSALKFADRKDYPNAKDTWSPDEGQLGEDSGDDGEDEGGKKGGKKGGGG